MRLRHKAAENRATLEEMAQREGASMRLRHKAAENLEDLVHRARARDRFNEAAA